jgi:hypothetical protein
MLTSQTFKQHVSLRNTSVDFSEINRLLAAAVVSRKFCALLLSDPALAITQGYAGERFSLSADEYNLVLSVRGSSLQEFATQLCEYNPRQPILTQSIPSKNYSDAYLTII